MFDRFLRERETLIAEYRLTENEQRALLETDFRSLYEMGVHSLLLGPLAAMLGLSFPDYLAILRGNVHQRPFHPLCKAPTAGMITLGVGEGGLESRGPSAAAGRLGSEHHFGRKQP
jgi:hypothetical protein